MKKKKLSKSVSEADDTLEQAKIVSAAARTWQAVAHDASELGERVTISLALELVLDADRIVTIGRLDLNILERVGYNRCEKILKKHKSSWF